MNILHLDSLDLGSMIIAGFIHDFEHFGFNNDFLIQTSHEWAVNYNDQSVCENHHVSAAYELLKDKKKNIFENTKKGEYQAMRKRIVSAVLETDMTKHFKELPWFSMMVSDPKNISPDMKEDDKIFIMSMLLHSSDISNPTKNWLVQEKWTFLLYVEFFNQGDQEQQLGLTVGMLNNRKTVNMAKAQLGFIDFLVKDLFTSVVKLLPKAKNSLDRLMENRKCWEGKVD